MVINEKTDGVNHINAYSKGKTALGRMLSNFEHSPFVHPELGRFESMEGFWFYISTGMQHEELRDMFGFTAKQYGSSMSTVYNPDFEDMIYEGLECKLTQNDHILNACRDNRLPYYHYYVWSDKPIKLDESFWIQALRKTIQKLLLFY